MMLAVTALALLGGVLAIDDEFPGYIHYTYANVLDTGNSPLVLTMEAFQTQCDTNSSCFLMSYPSDYPAADGWLSPVSQDFSMDTYYKNSSCGDQCASSVPTFVTGGLYARDVMYMKCNGCKMSHGSTDEYLNKYSMPPSQCAVTCNDDRRCVAMSITNDRQTCYTYAYVTRSYDAYLKVLPTRK